MYSDDHILSEDHALNGLPQLRKLVNSLLEKKIKKIGEREVAKRDIGTILSNCLPFYLTGSDSDVYPLRVLVQDLCSLALMEVEENSQKLNRTTSSWKTCSLELTVNVLNKVCSKRLLCNDYIDFLRFVFCVVDTGFVQSQRWVEDDITNVLVKFMNISTCFVAPDPLKEIWSLVWRRLPIAAIGGAKSFGNYLKVARCILKHINQTTMVANDAGQKLISGMVEKLFAVINDKGSKWNSQVEYIFELLALVIDDWGIECRDVVLRNCIPFASSLTAKLDFSVAASNDLESAYSFFDRLLHLAIPDCKMSRIVPNGALRLANSAHDVMRRALFSMSLSHTEYELKKDLIPLFARLIVIVYTSDPKFVENVDATVAVYTQHAKRRKENFSLDIITDWTFIDGIDYSDRPHLVVSCLSVGNEIASKWSHRIEPLQLSQMATKLWISRELIKHDWQLSSYCQLLDTFIKLGALDGLCAFEAENGIQSVISLWKLALSSAHVSSTFDTSSSLIVSIIRKFRSVIGEDEDIVDSVCEILSRTASPHGSPLYELLIFILTELEFDELRPFPGVSDKKKGIEQWRFRCQLAEWLVRHIHTECSISEVLYVMCQLHPKRSLKSASLPSKISGIEKDLELLGLSEAHITFEARNTEVPCLIIPEVVLYISQLFGEVWSDNGSTPEICVALWCSYLLFLSKLNISLDSPYVDLISIMEVWISDWISKTDAGLLSHINLINIHPNLISSDILCALCSRLCDCPTLGAYLVMFPVELNISTAIIRDVMSAVGMRYDIHDCTHVRSAAGNLLDRFTAEVDTVPDLLLLLDECGNIIEKDSRKRLERKILQLIEEDLASGEYDEKEAGIHRQRLSTCSLRLSEPYDCDMLDLNSVQTSFVIRHLSSLSRSLLSWELVSHLLKQAGTNAILVSKILKHVLADPMLFPLHPLIIGAVMEKKDMIQVLEELTPKLHLLLDCHYNSLMLSKTHPTRIYCPRISSPLRCDKLVELFRAAKIDALEVEHYTSALFLCMDDRQSQLFSVSFYYMLQKDPLNLLTSLWKAGKLSTELNSYMLLLHNLQDVISSGLLTAVCPSLSRGFLLTLYSLLTGIIHFVVRRNPEVIDSVFELISNFKCLSADDLLCLKSSLDSAHLKATDNVISVFAPIIKNFCTTGEIKDARVFHCEMFLKQLQAELLTNSKYFISDAVKEDILSTMLLVWDVLPSARRHIAPILSLFDESMVLNRKLDCYHTVRDVGDFCRLVLSDHRETRLTHAHKLSVSLNALSTIVDNALRLTLNLLESEEVFRCCMCILSSEAFQDRAILFPGPHLHKTHKIIDFGFQWVVSLYRDIVPILDENSSDLISSPNDNDVIMVEDEDPVCAIDSIKKLFRVISKYACCVPRLCQIILPYVFALDDSNAETAVSILLRYANVLVSAEADFIPNSLQPRFARCLAASVDGIGLRRLSRADLEYQLYFDGMYALTKCCLLCDLPTYAFAVANLLYDKVMQNEGQRCLAAFDGTKMNNFQLAELLKDVYLALTSVSSLKTLPMEQQNDDRVRILFSKARSDWLDVISNASASLLDLVDAYSYSGITYSGTCRELKYALAIRANGWSSISYPKRFNSHEERLFAYLYCAGVASLSSNGLKDFLVAFECELAECSEMPSLTSFNNLRDYSIIDLSSSLKNVDLKVLSTNRLTILAIYLLRLRDLNDGNKLSSCDLDIVVSELLKRFVDSKAFSPCLTLLRNCVGDRSIIENCRVLIAKGDINTAEHALRSVFRSTAICEIKNDIEARCLLAELLANHKNMLDDAIVLLQQILDKVNKVSAGSEPRLRIYLLLHSLAARQLSDIEEHMESRAFRMREDAIMEWTRQRDLASQRPPTHAARRIECELKCEKEAVNAIKEKLAAAAVSTVSAGLEALELLSEPYIKQPHQSKQRNDAILRHIFPLVDVIFRFDKEKDVVRALRVYVASGMVPAVWVHLVSHLMGHCFTKSILAPVIRTMIVKLIIAYPYHVLHTVLMYKFNENHAPIVETILEEAERRIANKGAKARLHEIIEDMTAAHVAYIQFVAAKVTDERFFIKRPIAGSRAVQYEMVDRVSIIRSSEVLRRVPLPIVEQKLCNPFDYSGDSLVKWESIERMCMQADGLSAPKVIKATGSDGRLYKLIWKNEDVRQDCLVEQLFSIVNSILNGDQVTAFLRTYKVVPLDSKCGIIEFCQGTVSMKQLLCGMDLLGGLHAEEEPQDEKAFKMRNLLKDVAKNQANQAPAIFRDACAHFQPVFRHFFYRNYTTVREWTKMIDSYRRSLAQWSIVTYVVGLGDRHLSNVLFEADTCKLVHIDLGMILEYSKRTLPIPERVPFRLTRDFLDPLLIEGTGGRLADEAVHAMQLLRDSKHVILGLASVLLRETISNFEEVDTGCGERPSFVSETAIARLRDKLNGTDNTFGQQLVQHQVRRLFAEATSADNISRMFIGWMGFV